MPQQLNDGRRSFDTVIIGGGSAGCVLASRISEDPSHRVLLLEAGPVFRTYSELPPALKFVRSMPGRYDWRFRSLPIPSLEGKSIAIPRGKVLGGSSAVHMGLALRPPLKNFEEWDLPGWRGSDVLPYFRRLEKDLDFGDALHSQAGRLPISRAKKDELVPLQKAFLETATNQGYREIADMNASDMPGVGLCPTNILAGVRWSAASAYIFPNSIRSNLIIHGETLVDRLEFSSKTGIRVHCCSGGRNEIVEAGRAILSAGTFGSPAILMRSGIGSATALKQVGVRCVIDLPEVGQNLQDHPVAVLAYLQKTHVGHKQDPFFQTLLRISRNNEDDISYHILPRSSSGAFRGLARGQLAFLLFVGLMRPQSRGTVSIQSTEPDAAPAIAPSYLADPGDRRELANATFIARSLLQNSPISTFLADELQPGISVANTPESLKSIIQTLATTYHHAVGTCRMGFDNDIKAVVDLSLKLKGAEKLFVVDASVMPKIVAANTNLTTMMIAEKFADMLTGTDFPKKET